MRKPEQKQSCRQRTGGKTRRLASFLRMLLVGAVLTSTTRQGESSSSHHRLVCVISSTRRSTAACEPLLHLFVHREKKYLNMSRRRSTAVHPQEQLSNQLPQIAVTRLGGETPSMADSPANTKYKASGGTAGFPRNPPKDAFDEMSDTVTVLTRVDISSVSQIDTYVVGLPPSVLLGNQPTDPSSPFRLALPCTCL